MKALVIAPHPFFTPRGTPFSVYYRTLVMASHGIEIDFLTYGQGQDVDIAGMRCVRIPGFRMLGEIPVGPSVFKLFLDVFMFAWAVAMLVRHRYEIVHAHEEAVFFCLILKPIFRFKLIYDMHSSLPQQLTNFGFTRSRLLIALFDRLESMSLRAADAVITICPDLEDYALTKIPPEKHFLIENSIFDDVRLADPGAPTEDGPAAPGPMPADRSVIAYCGTLEPYQGIDLLIRAFAEARPEIRDALLLIIGGTDAQVDRYAALARTLGVSDHCRFTGRLPQDVSRRHWRCASIVVSPRVQGTNTPLKVYEMLASGIPIVATDIHSHTQVLDDSVCFLAAPEPGPLAAALIEAMTDATRRARVIVAARARYEGRYAREAYEGKLRRLLESIGALDRAPNEGAAAISAAVTDHEAKIVS